jgi:hypothetical protein
MEKQEKPLMKIKTLALASAAVVALSGSAFAKAHHHATSTAEADARERAITQELNRQQLISPGSVPTAQASTQDSNQMAMSTSSAPSDQSNPPSQATTSQPAAPSDQSAAASSANTGTDNAGTSMAANDTSKSKPSDQSAATPSASAGTDSAGTSMAANDTSKSNEAMQKDSTAPQTDLGKATTAAGNQIDQASTLKHPVTKAEMKAAVPLSTVPRDTLKTAELKNRDGEALGEVDAITVDQSGKVASVSADVGGFLGVGQRTVSLDANGLLYLKSRNLIVTTMTKDEIGKLPPVTK